ESNDRLWVGGLWIRAAQVQINGGPPDPAKLAAVSGRIKQIDPAAAGEFRYGMIRSQLFHPCLPRAMRPLLRPPPPRAAGARVSQSGVSAWVANANILVGNPGIVAITLNRLGGWFFGRFRWCAPF